jgi:hypothetical protein
MHIAMELPLAKNGERLFQRKLQAAARERR